VTQIQTLYSILQNDPEQKAIQVRKK